MDTSKSNCIEYLKDLRKHPLSTAIREVVNNESLHKESIFINSKKEKNNQVEACLNTHHSPEVDRVVGSLVGLAVADSLGHNFEFDPVRDIVTKDKWFEYPTATNQPARGLMHNPLNHFQLQPGQFTDDTSMALCLADSILTCGELNGSDTRCWFWNWWNNGVNNAFRYDDTRSHSVGLGGNISRSVGNVSALARSNHPIPHHYEAHTEDAGNGSLMRLAPVVLRYHTDIALAREQAYTSSLTTHPGPIAAEACAFLAHLLVRGIHRPTAHPEGDNITVQQFLNTCVDEYITLLDVELEAELAVLKSNSCSAKRTLRRLLVGGEKDSSPERCWNWREESLMLSRTLGNRGSSYNGYPVSPGYFGSFSLDGLAMALHCVYHTHSFNMAIVKVVNMFGDADSTGAIAGQIAGSFYGVSQIEAAWIEDLRRWDPAGELELRALLLHHAGLLAGDTDMADTDTDTAVVLPHSCTTTSASATTPASATAASSRGRTSATSATTSTSKSPSSCHIS